MPGFAMQHDKTDCRMTHQAHPWPKRAAWRALAGLVVFAASPAAHARTAQEAQSLAERAVRHIADVGRDQAFADFSRPDGGYVDGELYIFCQDASGIVVAHGGNPRLVGQNLADVRGPDGRFANVEINHLGLTQGSGWLEFRWPNPATHRVGLKAAYVLKVDDHTVCGSGYYKEAPP
jgi:signal transduction histidine kinase